MSEATAWRAKLTEAFEALLRQPLSSYDPDATYAVYAWGNFVYEVGLDRLPGLIDPAVLGGAAVFTNGNLVINDEHPPLRIDGAGSIFAVPGGEAEGRELVGAVPKEWRVRYFRLASDGTLYDAMRVAAGLGDGPEDLVPYEGDIGEEWAEALAGADPAVREHLSWCCSDGLSGLTFWGAEEQDRVPRGTVVGSWQDEHGQWDMAVVSLP